MENQKKENGKSKGFSDIYEKMKKMEVLLDDDPLQFGPKRLNNKIAQIRNMLTSLERIFLSSSKSLASLKSSLRLEETKIAIMKADLFANDPEVRSGRNVADREATASVKMSKLITEKMRLSCSVAELEDLMIVIKAKRSDLRDTQSRLRDQIKLCHDEIGLGGSWGNHKPTIKLIPQDNKEDTDIDSILDHLEDDFNVGVKKNWSEEEKPAPTKEEVLPSFSDPDEVDKFLTKGLDRVLLTDDDVTFDSIFEENL